MKLTTYYKDGTPVYWRITGTNGVTAFSGRGNGRIVTLSDGEPDHDLTTCRDANDADISRAKSIETAFRIIAELHTLQTVCDPLETSMEDIAVAIRRKIARLYKTITDLTEIITS